MNDAEYAVILTETRKNLKTLVAAEHTLAGEAINNTLKLLAVLERQHRALSRKLASAAKPVAGDKVAGKDGK